MIVLPNGPLRISVIRILINRKTILILSLVSGVLSAAIPVVVLPALALFPGIAFGLFVMIPWAKACRFNLGAAAMCGLLSVGGYHVALRLGNDGGYLLAPVGSAIGTALAVLPGLIAGQGRVRRAACQAIGVGAGAAVIFPIADFAKSLFLAFVGIAVWQVAVASVLASALLDCSTPPPGRGSSLPR